MTDVAIAVWDDGVMQNEAEARAWEEVAPHVESLDGAGRSLVTIYRGPAHMAFGGSAKTGLIVYGTFDNQVFHQLVNPNGSNDPAAVMAGGQVGHYAQRHIVALGQALEALQRFMQEGRLDPEQQWDS